MHLTITRVDEILHDGDAYAVTLPGKSGEFSVMEGHMPLITTLRPGKISVRLAAPQSDPNVFEIEGGVVEVTPAGAIVLL